MTKIFSADLPITQAFKLTSRLRKLNDSGDTFCQRLNLFVAAILFILSFLSYGVDVILAKDNEGVSVYCYCPAEFPTSRVHFTNSVCFTKGFYYLPFDEPLSIPESLRAVNDNDKDNEDELLKYYPWVSHILLLQATLFCIPRLLWSLGAIREGFHHVSAIDMMDRHIFGDKDNDNELKSKGVNNIENYLTRLIQLRDSAICNSKLLPFIPTGYCYTVWFMATEFLMIGNSVSQFYLLDFLLGINFTRFGIDYLSQVPNLLWEDHSRFPRTAFCDLKIRQHTNIHTYTVQCALPSNMLNEKIFLLVWVMLLSVSAMNVLSFLHHLYTIQQMHLKTVEKINSYQLRTYFDTEKVGNVLTVKRFVYEYLKSDILVYLWQLSKGHKPLTDDVTHRLWNRYVGGLNGEVQEEEEVCVKRM
ncbi:innexin unc-9-like [Mizuhopecten yessoensis]|uniref:Innexin n=1 Tax=Mizuhopecten yessoensis TaxID=6573 RepID=A0A210Q0W3_MIZYE|nr:innexin unc-9-like [Mizuhopecten yessoensis]OWF42367.1 Innexin unc-9 [Mizuhopecten yessoensis]